MAEGNTWNKECPICKTAFVGESCPECAAAQAAIPTKVIPRANLFADAIKESPSTHLLPPGAEFQKGDKFHGLEILSIAGRGGMGAGRLALMVCCNTGSLHCQPSFVYISIYIH